MSYWSSRSYFAGGNGNGGNDQQLDGYGAGHQQYDQATGGKKRSPSRLKKSSGVKKDGDADDDYPKYAGKNSKDAADDSRYNRPNGTYYYGGGGGGGYGNSSPYGGGGYTLTPYNNAPAGFWAPQDGSRPPMFISTKEVHVYGMPAGYNNDSGNYSDDHQRRRGGGNGNGFFGPAFHAVGHFFDRKLGYDRE